MHQILFQFVQSIHSIRYFAKKDVSLPNTAENLRRLVQLSPMPQPLWWGLLRKDRLVLHPPSEHMFAQV